MNEHLKLLVKRYPSLEVCVAEIWKAFETLLKSTSGGGRIYLCGNGGSAADSEHWAGELLKGFLLKRPLSEAERANLHPLLSEKLQWGIPAIPLTGLPSLTTAFANDVDPSLVFAQLVHVLGRPGDVLVGLSTSGRSKNIIYAVEAARARGMKVVTLTGRGGGDLATISNVCIAVPENRTPEVQELHLPIYHCLSVMLEEKFDKQPSLRQANGVSRAETLLSLNENE